MNKNSNELARLVNILRRQIDHGRPRPRNSLLQNVAAIWQAYQTARHDVVKRFAVETVEAERILRVARGRGLLLECIRQGQLPDGAENFVVEDGAAFHASYATLSEKGRKTSLTIRGGAIESNRRRH